MGGAIPVFGERLQVSKEVATGNTSALMIHMSSCTNASALPALL